MFQKRMAELPGITMTPEEQLEQDHVTECRRSGKIVCPEEYDFLMPTHFSQLTAEENELIQRAREVGFRGFFSSSPSLEQQAKNYVKAAAEFLNRPR
jgi:hypothetical protein